MNFASAYATIRNPFARAFDFSSPVPPTVAKKIRKAALITAGVVGFVAAAAVTTYIQFYMTMILFVAMSSGSVLLATMLVALVCALLVYILS